MLLVLLSFLLPPVFKAIISFIRIARLYSMHRQELLEEQVEVAREAAAEDEDRQDHCAARQYMCACACGCIYACVSHKLGSGHSFHGRSPQSRVRADERETAQLPTASVSFSLASGPPFKHTHTHSRSHL